LYWQLRGIGMRDNRGMGVVEILLILITLIIFVLIFRNQFVWLVYKALWVLTVIKTWI
jgi:hypothetical protein